MLEEYMVGAPNVDWLQLSGRPNAWEHLEDQGQVI
jgi:hypothetical protein